MNECMNELPQVVVFDSSIPVQLAFYALVEHGELLKASRLILGRKLEWDG